MTRERLVLAAVVGVLVVASAAPILPIREGRALLLLLGLMALRSLAWSDGWRTAVMLTGLALFVGHRDPRGFPVLLGVYLACEGIETVRRLDGAEWLMLALAALGLLEAFHGIVQRFNLDPLTCVLARNGLACELPRHNQVVGFMGDPNTYGAVLALTLPAVLLVLRGRMRWAGAALMGVGLVLAKSVAPILGLGIAAGVWAWGRGPRAQWAVVGGTAVVLIGYLGVVDAPGVERAAIWNATVAALPEHPWFGHGLGSFAAAHFYDARYHMVWGETHHDWLQWAYETGVVGVAIVGAYLGRLAWRLWHVHGLPLATALQAMFAAAAVIASAHFIAHVAMTGVLLILMLGVIERVTAASTPWWAETPGA